MYGQPKVLGAATTGVGAVMLPATGSNRPLFYAAATLFVAGLVAMVASAVVSRKARKSEAQG